MKCVSRVYQTASVTVENAKFVNNAVNSIGQRSRKLRQPPPGNLLSGNADLTRGGKLHISLTDVGKQYGPLFQIQVYGKKLVVLNSVSTVRKALQDNGAIMGDRMSPFFQKYIFNDKGFSFAPKYHEKVGQFRCLLASSLQETKSRQNDLDRMSQLVRTFSSWKEGNPDQLLRSFLTNEFSNELIGQTIPEDDPDHNALWELINHLYTLLDPSIEMPLKILPVLRFLPGKYGDCFRKTIQARDRVAKKYFESQKETYEHGQVRGLVDVCLKIQHEETKEKGTTWLTDDYIKGLIYDTAAAGLSEMMKTLRLLVLLSCHYQDHQSRVQLEIDDVIGSDVPTEEHRRSMPYTQAFILEMLRYVSQTPLAIPHKCNKDIVLDGYLIEKNSGILPNLWGIHHDEKIWGDPWEFRPERFLENGALLPGDHKLMQSLIPFSVGKRQCPGKNFALSRTFVILTSLLQKLRFLPSDDEPLPSADPRLYSARYPLELPVYKCKVVPRLSAEDADAEVKAEVTHRMYP